MLEKSEKKFHILIENLKHGKAEIYYKLTYQHVEIKTLAEIQILLQRIKRKNWIYIYSIYH